MADRVGQQLGNYRVLRLLGRGAFAEVYLGEHQYLEILAAIKVLHVHMEPKTHESFRREARTIAHLQHPHIVQVLDFGLDDQTPYLVMDYIPGGTLRSHHPKGTRVPVAQVVSYVKQIASALDYAHRQWVIHRDVKPDNLLLNATQQVVLSDFGLAVVQRSLDSFSSSNPAAGSPLYMAPEQIQQHPCAASDQYALGVMVYEWLCGEPPFHGPGAAVFGQHLYQPPPRLRERLSDLPVAVEETIFKALAKDSKQRFSDVQTFALSLEQAVHSIPPPSFVPAFPAALSPASAVILPPPQSLSSTIVPSPSHPFSQTTEEIAGSDVLPQALGDTPSVRENPFTYGNPISDPARFIGRLPEVAQVFSRLRNIEFESSSLVGERRVGKTSLLNYIAHPTVRRSHGLDPDKYIFVYVDLQMVNKDTTSTRLWQQLLRQMARCCQTTEVKRVIAQLVEKELIDTFSLADVFDRVDEHDQYVVFLLDEFENVTENPNFGPDFFYGLRSLAIHHHLSLVTCSRHGLIELCHSEAIRSSPFFNIFANINLGLFSEADARHLISTSLAKTNVGFAEAEIATILRIAGCHPYFLQSACFFLFEAYSKNLNPDERMAFLRKAFREEATPHLSDYWRTSNEQEKTVLLVLSLLERQRTIDGQAFSSKQLQDLYSRSEQVLGRLEKRGLLTSEANTWRLFNATFSEWICNEITTTMHDQQRYSEWLKANNDVLTGLSTWIKEEMGKLLPKISDRYRKLIASWVSESRNPLPVLELLKGAPGEN